MLPALCIDSMPFFDSRWSLNAALDLCDWRFEIPAESYDITECGTGYLKLDSPSLSELYSLKLEVSPFYNGLTSLP